jgi:hypothetical protein
MLNETTQNLLKVMQEFQWPEPKPVTYRLYYDQQGWPICYTMEDLAGTYIEIDAATHALSAYNVRVIDQQIQIQHRPVTVSKLIPGDQGIPCHAQDICVVVDAVQKHIKWKTVTHELS